ncbi:hypothetical protein JCM9279_003761 [Rhodotorula babjevae]
MDSMQHATAVWPEGQDYLRPIVATLYLFVVGLLSILLSRRWGSWHYMRRLPLIQILVIVLLAASLAFIFISAILVLGVGSSYSEAACDGGIWLCVLLYAGTKAVLYYLLLEKLQRVHAHGVRGRVGRFHSWWYRGGVVLFVAWLAVAVTMIVGRISHIRRDDGACIIGLRLYATVPMLAVDAITNIYLTTGFCIPVWRSKNEKARRLAKVSSLAAFASLVTSFANVLVLSILHGHQLSFVCLGSCGLDVVFNSIVCYLVTTARHARDEQTSMGSTDMRIAELSGTTQGPTAVKNGTKRSSSRVVGAVGSAHGGGAPFGSVSGIYVNEEVCVESELDEEPAIRSSRRNSALGFSRAGGAVSALHTVSFSTPEVSTALDDVEEEKLAAGPAGSMDEK